MSKWLTDTMLYALRDVANHGDPAFSARGMAERGGRAQTTQALKRRGLIEDYEREPTESEKASQPTLVRVFEWRLTEAGHLILRDLP